MKLNLPTLTAEQQAIALTPEIGAESSKVMFTTEPCHQLGVIEVTGSNTDSFVFSSEAVDLGGGADIHLRVQNPLAGGTGGAVSVQVNVVYGDDSTGTATATLDIPAWSKIKQNVFAAGHATDFIPDAPGDVDKKIKSVQSVAAVNNTQAGNRFAIFSTPAADKFTSIGCAKAKDGAFNSPTTLHIQCGYDATAFTKKGVSQPSNLTLSYNYVTAMDSLVRVNGHYVTVLVKTVKDDMVPFEQRIYTRHLVSVKDSRGEGNDEVVATSEGAFEDLLVGYAR